MALTSAQIVAQAVQVARCPGYTSQAGQLLNSILADLAETYDLDLAKGTFNFTFNTAAAAPSIYPNALPGSVLALPADFLRFVDNMDVVWYLLGVPYSMIPVDLSEFDNTVQQAGLQSYPYLYATDMSQSPPNMLVYPPPSGNYSGTGRYRRQMPDITTPETSSVVPWFPNQQYLLTRLAGELMRITDDERAALFLGDSDVGAVGILDRYLKMKDDQNTRAKTVKLDRRQFGRKFSGLKNTKLVGW